jgi:endoglycosylceramidase
MAFRGQLRTTATLLLLALPSTTALAPRIAACDNVPIHVVDDSFATVPNATRVLVDGCGRVRNFRGMNSVNKQVPYYPDPNVFAPDGTSLSPEMAAIWQSLGLNLVRLGVMWSGAVPHARGSVNATYLSVLANLTTSLFVNNGILSMLDAHQDGFSPAFCDDGAPPWAALDYAAGVPAFPEPLAAPCPINTTTGVPLDCAGCANVAWSELYFTHAVSRAFQV